jgi:hypothetical protein
VGFPYINTDYIGKHHRVRYHLAGAKRKWRTAWVDPAVVPDARAWLEARLGPLAGYEVVCIHFVLKAEGFSVGALDWGVPPVLTVRPGPGQEGYVPAPTPPLHWSEPGAPPLVWLEVPEPENCSKQHFETGSKKVEGGDSSWPWPTPKALEPFVSREEIEAFWALPPRPPLEG